MSTENPPSSSKSSSEILNELFSTFNSSFSSSSGSPTKKNKKKKRKRSNSGDSKSSVETRIKKAKKEDKLLLKKKSKKTSKTKKSEADEVKHDSPKKSKKTKIKTLPVKKVKSKKAADSGKQIIGDGFVIFNKNLGSSKKEVEDGEIIDEDERKEPKRKKRHSIDNSFGDGFGSSSSKKGKLSASQAYKLDEEEKLLLGYPKDYHDSHHRMKIKIKTSSSSSKSHYKQESNPSTSSSYYSSSTSSASTSRRRRSRSSSPSRPRLAPPRERDAFRSSYLKFQREREHQYANNGSSNSRSYDSNSYYDYHSTRGRSSYSSARGGFGYVGKSYYYDDVEEEDEYDRKRRSRRDSDGRYSSSSSSSSHTSWRHRHPSPSRGRSYYHPDDIIDKTELLEIARKNAKKLMKRGVLPSDIFSRDQILAIKAGGKSVEELTVYCKKLARRDARGDARSGSDDGSDDDDDRKDFIHHPFHVKDKPLPTITLNIRNAVPLPVRTPQELAIESAKLRTVYPVSSGTQHRYKELEWKPVSEDDEEEKKKKELASKAIVPLGEGSSSSLATGPNVATVAPMMKETEEESDKVEEKKSDKDIEEKVPTSKPNADGGLLAIEAGPSSGESVSKKKPKSDISVDGPDLPLVDISSVIGLRLKAMRLLQEKPGSSEAQKQLDEATEMMKHWADAKAHEPKFLTPQELASGPQAWAKKDQLRKLRSLDSGMGKHLLLKMGWTPGTGLGKNKEGQLEPLALDVKTDKKGLTAAVEEIMYGKNGGLLSGKGPSMPLVYDLSGKHPVSALMELTAKRRWGAPEFELCFEHGPPHQRQFVYKVIVNGVEYQPCVAVGNKKQAKANAAAFCLQSLGLLPTNMAPATDGSELLQTVGSSGVQEPVSSSSYSYANNEVTGGNSNALGSSFGAPTYLQTVGGNNVVNEEIEEKRKAFLPLWSNENSSNDRELMPPPPPPQLPGAPLPVPPPPPLPSLMGLELKK